MKLKYEYEPWPKRPNMPTFCDVYVCGQKVIEGHDGTRNHVYVPVDSSIKVTDIKLKPYDSRVELKNEMKDNVLVIKKPRKKKVDAPETGANPFPFDGTKTLLGE